VGRSVQDATLASAKVQRGAGTPPRATHARRRTRRATAARRGERALHEPRVSGAALQRAASEDDLRRVSMRMMRWTVMLAAIAAAACFGVPRAQANDGTQPLQLAQSGGTGSGSTMGS